MFLGLRPIFHDFRGDNDWRNPTTERQPKRKKRGSDSRVSGEKFHFYLYCVGLVVWKNEADRKSGGVGLWICHGSSGKCQERSGSLARIESRVALAGKPVWLWHRQDPVVVVVVVVPVRVLEQFRTAAHRSFPPPVPRVTSPGFRLLWRPVDKTINSIYSDRM